jgi:hypothetical protein
MWSKLHMAFPSELFICREQVQIVHRHEHFNAIISITLGSRFSSAFAKVE